MLLKKPYGIDVYKRQGIGAVVGIGAYGIGLLLFRVPVLKQAFQMMIKK